MYILSHLKPPRNKTRVPVIKTLHRNVIIIMRWILYYIVESTVVVASVIRPVGGELPEAKTSF